MHLQQNWKEKSIHSAYGELENICNCMCYRDEQGEKYCAKLTIHERETVHVYKQTIMLLFEYASFITQHAKLADCNTPDNVHEKECSYYNFLQRI